MSYILKVYNSDEVIVTFGPIIIQNGLADGEFLKIEGEADTTEEVVGTDGEVAVSRINDSRATATILLMQTSEHNDQLSVFENLCRNAKGMVGAIQPFAILDLNGRTKLFGANSWVQKAPDRSWDRTATTNEWTIRIAHLARIDGGN